jgi:hypothetical protein
MWKTIADWAAAFFGMARELQDHRASIRELERRVRDLEEVIKLLSLEQRHAREMESAEREKLILQLQTELSKHQLPLRRKRK